MMGTGTGRWIGEGEGFRDEVVVLLSDLPILTSPPQECSSGHHVNDLVRRGELLS